MDPKLGVYDMICKQLPAVFAQLKKGLESIALELSDDDSETLKELFMRLNLIDSNGDSEC